MKEIHEILDSIKTARQFKQIHIDTIVDIYLENEDIDPDELFNEIERFSKKIVEPYSITKKKFEKSIEKAYRNKPEEVSAKSGLYSIADMKKPWEITEDMGYMVYQDKASTKNLYFIKSFERLGHKKEIFIKTDDKSLINLLNSFAYQHQTKWNKPLKQNGIVVGMSEELVDFKEADLTRFAHREIVFDPRTEDNIITFENRECINSYSAPKLLSLKKQNDVNNAWPLELADFFRLLWNLCSEDHKAQIYLLNWLVKNYQTKEVAQTFIILCGENGTGKGQLMKIIINIYGTEMVGTGSPENNIFSSKENVQLKDSLYYHADEVKMTPEIWEQSKNFIANHKFTLKANFENVRTYPNYAAFIFNMNIRKGQIPFNIPTQQDRRTTAIESYTPLHQTKWFNQQVNDKFEMDKTFAKNVAQFLADFDYDNALLKFPLNNDLRQRMLFAGKPNMERYAEALANRDMDWFLSQGLETFDWINTDGRKAAAYTWVEHLSEAFDDDFIQTISIRTLYKLLFDDKEFKKETLINAGLEEKVKSIPMKDGNFKSKKVYIFPKVTNNKEEEIVEIEEPELDMNIINGVDSSTNPPKKTGIRNLKKIGGKR